MSQHILWVSDRHTFSNASTNTCSVVFRRHRNNPQTVIYITQIGKHLPIHMIDYNDGWLNPFVVPKAWWFFTEIDAAPTDETFKTVCTMLNDSRSIYDMYQSCYPLLPERIYTNLARELSIQVTPKGQAAFKSMQTKHTNMQMVHALLQLLGDDHTWFARTMRGHMTYENIRGFLQGRSLARNGILTERMLHQKAAQATEALAKYWNSLLEIKGMLGRKGIFHDGTIRLEYPASAFLQTLEVLPLDMPEHMRLATLALHVRAWEINGKPSDQDVNTILHWLTERFPGIQFSQNEMIEAYHAYVIGRRNKQIQTEYCFPPFF